MLSRLAMSKGWWAATVVFAAVAAAWAWAGIQPAFTAPLPNASNIAEVRMMDFRDAIYYPVKELLAGGNPYDPAAMLAHWPIRQTFNLYLPYHLMVTAPFALDDYRSGAAAFTGVTLVLVLLIALMAAWQLRARVPLLAGFAGFSALLLVGEVGKGQLFVGQINPYVAIGAAGTFLLRRAHPGWAMFALAMAWVKPQYGLPIAVLLMFRGSWRVAAGGTAIAALASLPVVGLLMSRDGFLGFFQTLARNISWSRSRDYLAVDSVTAHRPDVAGVFFRVTGLTVPMLEVVVLVVVLVATGLLARRLDAMSNRTELTPVADLMCLTAVVIALIHQPGDILCALPAMAAVVAVFWRRFGDLGWMPVLAVALLLVTHLHHQVVDHAIVAIAGARAAVTVDGVAMIAAWLVLVVYALLRTRVAAPRPQSHLAVVAST